MSSNTILSEWLSHGWGVTDHLSEFINKTKSQSKRILFELKGRREIYVWEKSYIPFFISSIFW